jgi:hypothetical protein
MCSIWNDAAGRVLLECSMQRQDKKRHSNQPAKKADAVHAVAPSAAGVPASASKRLDASDFPPAKPKVRMQRRPFSDN